MYHLGHRKEIVSKMLAPTEYKSPYSRYVAAVFEAHGKELLKLALSGSFMKSKKKRIAPLSEADAKDCVQVVFAYFLNGIKDENAKVMGAIRDSRPESDDILFMLIPILQYRADDIEKRKRRNLSGAGTSRKVSSGIDRASREGELSFVERHAEKNGAPWHQLPLDPEAALIELESGPLKLLADTVSQAVAACWLTQRDQEVFQLLVKETIGEITDDDAAREMGTSLKRYQNMRSELKRKLREYSQASIGVQHD
jgi:hypothetical protein